MLCGWFGWVRMEGVEYLSYSVHSRCVSTRQKWRRTDPAKTRLVRVRLSWERRQRRPTSVEKLISAPAPMAMAYAPVVNIDGMPRAQEMRLLSWLTKRLNERAGVGNGALPGSLASLASLVPRI